MPKFAQGQIDSVRDYAFTVKETGEVLKGVTFQLLDIGERISISADDPTVVQSVKAAQPRSVVQVQYTDRLDTNGGQARIKYKAITALRPVRQ